MRPAPSQSDTSSSHPLRLKTILQQINNQDCPEVPNPPGCKKRASVALILRVSPKFPHQALYDKERYSSVDQPFQKCLDNFFSQEWVQDGDAEVLFIKRAARVGDRWTSHIALPGGKRDPADFDDRATSSRETKEEIGLDLDVDHCLYVGNLPERLVEPPWGGAPLMVLCPFVYLALRHDLPRLTLQPAEVHSAHWVALRGLLAPSLRTVERWDLAKGSVVQQGYMMQLLTRATAGYMLFGGIRLVPTESLYCSSTDGFIPEIKSPPTWIESANRILSSTFTGGRTNHIASPDRPLILWGLTMGIIADFLELLDAHATSKLWFWPTFSPPDISLLTRLLTYNFRTQKLRELSSKTRRDETRISGFDALTFTTSILRQSKGSESGIAGGILLEGYFARLFRALYVALLARFGFCLALTAFIIRRYRRRIR